MPEIIDETGNRYGLLVVQGYAGRNKQNHIMWECLCDCGDTRIVYGGSLRAGLATTCSYHKSKIMITEDGRICTVCQVWKPWESFYLENRGRPGGRTSDCKDCRRDKHIFRNYGLTREAYEQLLNNQNGTCAICNIEYHKPLRVDHDHSCCPDKTTCGECVRGLLCDNCNGQLGWYESYQTEVADYLSS